MRKVFLEGLPTKERNGKQIINWKESIRYKVKFVYDDVEGEIEIVDYKLKEQLLFVKYKNNIYKINTSQLLKHNLNKVLKKITIDFKINLGTNFKDENRDLVIIDREYRDNPHNKGKHLKYYKYKCNKCSYEGWMVESNLIHGNRCPACCDSPQVVAQGINDIPTTAPWMIKYFQGGYEEAKLYNKCSMSKIYPICPDCGQVRDKPIRISDIHRNHSIGCICSDGISYSEKIMYSVLKQLNIGFMSQLTKVKFEWCKEYRYDFYFMFNNEHFIIETHGIQHYKYTGRGVSLQKEQENDRLKKQLAKENGIEHYIVIDCKESELKYIKNNILNSELSNIFDLNKINWLKCEEFALNNLVKIACEYKKNNPDLTTINIGEMMDLNCITIRKYLKRGTKLGWCNYDPKEENFKGSSKSGKKSGKAVEIFKDDILIGIAESTCELAKQSEKLFGVKLVQQSISKVCTGEFKQYKGFTFKYI